MRLLIAAALAGFAVSSIAQTVSPGMWHDETAYTLNGKPLPTTQAPDECLAEADADAKNIRKTMEYRMKRDNIHCTITNWDYAGSTLQVALSCANAQGRGTAKVTGTVTPTRYDLKGQGSGQTAQGGPYTMAWSWRGKRVGDCR
ncbi:hypothetical protein WM32_16295 [Burkholderia ubonensis]|uniref:DUF3617 domain-containing protein n=1 Tax=Burkholderia ubonensis TaxID=101571 RepID=UPI000755A4FD|nr:DUF3617 family protein [Burkholderia ubonensis]KVT84909.1 hypothetical protein WK58_30020 [Burkholderia ubonensis]KWO85349.1 hypothetical protein WM32_16295 [Burkholderia ubonensis]